MKSHLQILSAAAFGLVGLVWSSSSARAAEGKSFEFGQPKKYELTAPADWISKQPRTRIVDVEFETPKAEGDEIAGRVTVMGAGGGIEPNIARWKEQFRAPEGEEVKAEQKKLTIAGKDVHVVSIRGLYLDKPGGPFAGGQTIERPDYRMLGAIIVTQDGGDYFVKLYGPEKTITAAEPAFNKMLETLKAK